MHQILFRLGLRPKPRWGDYSARSELLAGMGRPTSKRMGGKEGKMRGKLRKGGKERREEI